MSPSTIARHATPAAAEPSRSARRSRGGIVLYVLWAVFAVTTAIALGQGKSLRDDGVSLAALALFVTSAVVGSRVWLSLQKRDAHQEIVKMDAERSRRS